MIFPPSTSATGSSVAWEEKDYRTDLLNVGYSVIIRMYQV